MEGLVGFEPTLRELQSHALPLGYRPISLNSLILYNYSIKVSTIFANLKLNLFFYILFSMNNDRVNELIIDEWIWGIFIILSILNISGDELEKNCYFNYDYNTMKKSKNIFRFTVFCSFLIYLYLAYKNYNKYHILKTLGKDTSLASTRVIASILVVIASSLYLTAQLNDKVPTNPSIQ